MRVELDKRRFSLKAALAGAEQYEKAAAELASSECNAKALIADLRKAELTAEKAKYRFERAESDLARVQALHLASKLAPGEACPVCGSHDHPAPANGHVEHAGLDNALREAKAAWTKDEANRQNAAARASQAQGALQAHQASLSGLALSDETSLELRKRVQCVAAEIAALGAETDLDDTERQVEDARLFESAAQLESETAREVRENASREAAAARGKYDQAIEAIPEGIRDRTALNQARTSAEATLRSRRHAFKEAEEEDRLAREVAVKAVADSNGARSAFEQSDLRREKAAEAYRQRLDENGLTEEDYQTYKMSIPLIEVDSETAEGYDKKVEFARKDKDDAEESVSGYERPVLMSLATKLQQAEEVQRTERDNLVRVKLKLEALRDLRRDIKQKLERIDVYEAKSATLRALSALFNADNSQRLYLETYAIGAMFDHVLAAANLRLSPMTNSQYFLKREEEASGGRSRRGLGICVFDSHTGRTRSVLTLSGGETFITALALALGLSDVVESTNGKVHLDTIFIDEGFGSLDAESTLDQVLQVLINLVGRRRAVGLISHVPMVQEAVPNGFYVVKEAGGSRIEARTGR